MPQGRKGADLRQHGLGGAAPLPSTGVGNHTKRAEVVTPPHHRHPGVYPRNARRSNVLVQFILREVGIDLMRLSGGGAGQKLGNRPIIIGAYDEVHAGMREELLFEVLRHATENPNDQARLAAAPQAFKIIQAMKDLLVGVLPDRTTVEQNCLRRFRRRRQLMARLGQDRPEKLAVVFIHLTSIGFNIDAHDQIAPHAMPAPTPSSLTERISPSKFSPQDSARTPTRIYSGVNPLQYPPSFFSNRTETLLPTWEP